jgi:hypothetical protein
VPSVKRNTAEGHDAPVGVLAVTAMRKMVIGWSIVTCPPVHVPLRLPGKKDGKIILELVSASVPAGPVAPVAPVAPGAPGAPGVPAGPAAPAAPGAPAAAISVHAEF